MSLLLESQSLAHVGVVELLDGKAGGVGNFNCVTTPLKGDGGPFPDDVSFTGGLFVTRETFLGGDVVFTEVGVVARMTMI
jgi:hypothetical protein